jgi:bloom syndrome protein
MSTVTTLIKEHFHGKHGIVYCLTKQNCEEMSKRLNGLDISSRFYHGGMEDDARSEAQLNWIQRNVLVQILRINMYFV